MKKIINWDKSKFQIIFMILLLISSLFYYISLGNIEFIFHLIIFTIIFILLLLTDQVFNYAKYAIWLFCFWAFFHMLGGAIFINGTRLYSIILINIVGEPFNIFRFDQAIHIYCYFVVTILLYSIVKKYIKKVPVGILLLVFFASIGISAINEIVEFFMAIGIADNGIGDYYNTSLDLISNSVGSFIGIIYLKFFDNSKQN